MSELFTLEKALLMRVGDELLQWKDEHPVKYIDKMLVCTVTNSVLIIMPGHVTGKYWKIVQPEPRVLTPEEYSKKIRNDYGSFSECSGCEPAFIYGHQNGRLERDLELKSFIEYTKNMLNDFNSNIEIQRPVMFRTIKQLIKEIPPLIKNDY